MRIFVIYSGRSNIIQRRSNLVDPLIFYQMPFCYSSLKLVYIFSVNPHLGPLQVSLSRMVMDIMKFFFLYVLVLFAFSCGKFSSLRLRLRLYRSYLLSDCYCSSFYPCPDIKHLFFKINLFINWFIDRNFHNAYIRMCIQCLDATFIFQDVWCDFYTIYHHHREFGWFIWFFYFFILKKFRNLQFCLENIFIKISFNPSEYNFFVIPIRVLRKVYAECFIFLN